MSLNIPLAEFQFFAEKNESNAPKVSMKLTIGSTIDGTSHCICLGLDRQLVMIFDGKIYIRRNVIMNDLRSRPRAIHDMISMTLRTAGLSCDSSVNGGIYSHHNIISAPDTIAKVIKTLTTRPCKLGSSPSILYILPSGSHPTYRVLPICEFHPDNFT